MNWPPDKMADWLKANAYSHVLLCPTYGMRLFNRMEQTGVYSISPEDIRKKLQQAGYGLAPTDDPFQAVLKDRRRLIVISEELARRKAKALSDSGRFQLVYDNVLTRCLAVK